MLHIILVLLFALTGCASQPRVPETVWVTVVDVYSPKEFQQSFNKPVVQRFMEAGFDRNDTEAGRLLKVACGLGTDYTWGSYAHLPAGMTAREKEVVLLRIDERMGLNPVASRIEEVKSPGRFPVHRYIPDWKERNLFLNIERIPLAPEQEGRYVVSHGSHVIKCRQGR